MERFGGLEFHTFSKEDVSGLAPVMKRAFDAGAKKDRGRERGGPPGYDNGEFLRKFALDPKSDSYRVAKDGKDIGGVIVWVNRNGVSFLGCMFVDAALQGKGVGTTVWKYIEQKYPQTKVWRTETPGFSRANHAFYVNKCGFKIVKIDQPKDPEEISYKMEKVMAID